MPTALVKKLPNQPTEPVGDGTNGLSVSEPPLSKTHPSRALFLAATATATIAAGIIDGERRGREHVWTINPARLAEAQRHIEVIAQGWDDALARLKAHVEER